MLSFVLALLLSFALGSINLSVWLGKKMKGVDIRELGSGNAGTTNTFRLLGWKAGSITAIIDILKGFVSAKYVSLIAINDPSLPHSVVGWNTDAWIVIMCGLFSVLGHMFPPQMGFKGGKGVITAAGMLFAVEPYSISLALVVFILTMFSSRYVSLASIIATISYPVFLGSYKYVLHYRLDPSFFIFSLVTSAAIVIKHIPNIKRLMAGTENRVRSFAPAKGWLNKSADELKGQNGQ